MQNGERNRVNASAETGGGAPPSPALVLREHMARRGASQAELARALGVSRVRINHIVSGRSPIGADMAVRLGKVFGMAPEFWAELQMRSDLHAARIRLRPHLDAFPELGRPVNENLAMPNEI